MTKRQLVRRQANATEAKSNRQVDDKDENMSMDKFEELLDERVNDKFKKGQKANIQNFKDNDIVKNQEMDYMLCIINKNSRKLLEKSIKQKNISKFKKRLLQIYKTKL